MVSLTGLVQRWGKTGEGLGEHRREEVGAVEEEDRDEATAAGHGVHGSGRPYDLETGGDSRGCLRADKVAVGVSPLGEPAACAEGRKASGGWRASGGRWGVAVGGWGAVSQLAGEAASQLEEIRNAEGAFCLVMRFSPAICSPWGR